MEAVPNLTEDLGRAFTEQIPLVKFGTVSNTQYPTQPPCTYRYIILYHILPHTTAYDYSTSAYTPVPQGYSNTERKTPRKTKALDLPYSYVRTYCLYLQQLNKYLGIIVNKNDICGQPKDKRQ